jgi:hypothetical protein
VIEIGRKTAKTRECEEDNEERRPLERNGEVVGIK